MKLVPVQQRPIFRIRCGQQRPEGGRCWHDAVVADIDAPAFSIEAYYCEEHRQQCEFRETHKIEVAEVLKNLKREA